MKTKRGRPTTYTDAAAAFILQGIRRGETIAAMHRADPSVPVAPVVRDWARRDPHVFGKRLAAARVEGFEAFARDQLGITADTPANRQRWARWKAEELDGTIRWSLLAKWDPLRRRKILAGLAKRVMEAGPGRPGAPR